MLNNDKFGILTGRFPCTWGNRRDNFGSAWWKLRRSSIMIAGADQTIFTHQLGFMSGMIILIAFFTSQIRPTSVPVPQYPPAVLLCSQLALKEMNWNRSQGIFLHPVHRDLYEYFWGAEDLALIPWDCWSLEAAGSWCILALTAGGAKSLMRLFRTVLLAIQESCSSELNWKLQLF